MPVPLLTVALFATALALAICWIRWRVVSDAGIARLPLVLLPLALGLLAVQQVARVNPPPATEPVLLAIAADVSLSMGTRPAPGDGGEQRTRLARAQQVLRPVLAGLDAGAGRPLVSLLAFTSSAETIMAWDDDTALAGEFVEYLLGTGLLTEAGSDLGAALEAAVPLFENLPEAWRDPAYRKFLLLVSDGEQTRNRTAVDVPLTKLRGLGVQIVSLHAGLPDTPEGLPVYDDDGAYLGFEEVGGKTVSTPDEGIMRLVAGEAGADSGYFTKAERSGAAAAILDYIGIRQQRSMAAGWFGVTSLLLWGLLQAGLLKFT